MIEPDEKFPTTDPYVDDETYASWPVRAVLMMCPASEIGGVEFASPWVAHVASNVLQSADPDDVRKLLRAIWIPVRDRQYFIERAALIYDAMVIDAEKRGIELPDSALRGHVHLIPDEGSSLVMSGEYSIVNGWVCQANDGELENLFTIAQAEKALAEVMTGAHRGQTKVGPLEFDPDWTISPHVTLSSIVEDRGWEISHVADNTDVSDVDVAAYLSGLQTYPASWAVAFAKMVGCSADFVWNLQNNHLLSLAQGKTDITREVE